MNVNCFCSCKKQFLSRLVCSGREKSALSMGDPIKYAAAMQRAQRATSASQRNKQEGFRTGAMITIKKYSNRRLYDTSQSQYVTLEELADRIRDGADVRVIDAKTNEDLTQGVLAQIIIESRGAGKLLPTKMLTQLIRMEDDVLAEFFGQYMSWALSMYLRMKQTRQRISPFGQQSPFGAPNPFSQWLGSLYNWPGFQGQQPDFPIDPSTAPPYPNPGNMPDFEPEYEPEPEPEPAPKPVSKAPKKQEAALASATPGGEAEEKSSEVSQMRQELDELKELLKQVALNQAKQS